MISGLEKSQRLLYPYKQVRDRTLFMERFQTWFHRMALLLRAHPPRLVESVMLLLAAVLTLVWLVEQRWPYLVLSLGYIGGAIASMLVRELLSPSPQTWQVRLTALASIAMLTTWLSVYLHRAVHFF